MISPPTGTLRGCVTAAGCWGGRSRRRSSRRRSSWRSRATATTATDVSHASGYEHILGDAASVSSVFKPDVTTFHNPTSRGARLLAHRPNGFSTCSRAEQPCVAREAQLLYLSLLTASEGLFGEAPQPVPQVLRSTHAFWDLSIPTSCSAWFRPFPHVPADMTPPA